MREKDANQLQKCVLLPAAMSDTPRTRIRQRIKRLLEDRGRTQRDFAKWLSHGDQWASNLLRGDFALSLDELDRVAAFFNVPPGEIVRVSDEAWELMPTEMRVVRALRMLPPSVRDYYATLADYLVGAVPDEIDRIMQIRELGAEEMEVIDRWIAMKRFERANGRGAADRVAAPLEAPPSAARVPQSRVVPTKAKDGTTPPKRRP